MKELKKPERKKVVFENVSITSLSENGTYYDFYARSRSEDTYKRGTETDLSEEILF